MTLMTLMTLLNIPALPSQRLLRAPDGAGAGGGEAGNDTVGGGGGDTLTGGGSDTLAGGNDTIAGGGNGQRPWWEADGTTEETRAFFKANGLTVDDPAEAARKAADMARHAQKRLGHKPEELMLRPKDPKALAEWMRENRDIFGLPEKPEDYAIAKPEGFDGEWDDGLARQMQAAGYEAGVPPAAMQKLTGIYAEHVKTLMGRAQDDLAQATEAMRSELTKDWGDNYQANVTRARQAAQVIAERASMDGDALSATLALLSEKTGDANTMKLFHAIGQAMGDDTALALGKGNGSYATSPAEARAEAAKLRSPGGEYYEAVNKGDRTAMDRLKPRLTQLDRLASGG